MENATNDITMEMTINGCSVANVATSAIPDSNVVNTLVNMVRIAVICSAKVGAILTPFVYFYVYLPPGKLGVM